MRREQRASDVAGAIVAALVPHAELLLRDGHPLSGEKLFAIERRQWSLQIEKRRAMTIALINVFWSYRKFQSNICWRAVVRALAKMRLELFEVVIVRGGEACGPDDVREGHRLFKLDQSQVLLLVEEDFLDCYLHGVAFVTISIFVPRHKVTQAHRRHRPKGFAVVDRGDGCEDEVLRNENALAEGPLSLRCAFVEGVGVNEGRDERHVVADPLAAISHMQGFLRHDVDGNVGRARDNRRLNRGHNVVIIRWLGIC